MHSFTRSSSAVFPAQDTEPTVMVDVHQPATIRRLAEALMFALNIRPGIQLPFVLGHGECESNNQALYVWIVEQVGGEQWYEPDELFNSLATQLQCAIDRWRATI